MASIRSWHNYLSILVAPTIVFFAFTGSLQLFGLHESHGSYHAPVLLQELGRLHKDQIWAPQKKHDVTPKPAPDQRPPPATPAGEGDKLPVYALKWVAALAALALIVSACLGVWLAMTHIKRWRLSLVLLLAGTVLPVVLVLL